MLISAIALLPLSCQITLFFNCLLFNRLRFLIPIIIFSTKLILLISVLNDFSQVFVTFFSVFIHLSSYDFLLQILFLLNYKLFYRLLSYQSFELSKINISSFLTTLWYFIVVFPPVLNHNTKRHHLDGEKI